MILILKFAEFTWMPSSTTWQLTVKASEVVAATGTGLTKNSQVRHQSLTLSSDVENALIVKLRITNQRMSYVTECKTSTFRH